MKGGICIQSQSAFTIKGEWRKIQTSPLHLGNRKMGEERRLEVNTEGEGEEIKVTPGD